MRHKTIGYNTNIKKKYNTKGFTIKGYNTKGYNTMGYNTKGYNIKGYNIKRYTPREDIYTESHIYRGYIYIKQQSCKGKGDI